MTGSVSSLDRKLLKRHHFLSHNSKGSPGSTLAATASEPASIFVVLPYYSVVLACYSRCQLSPLVLKHPSQVCILSVSFLARSGKEIENYPTTRREANVKATVVCAKGFINGKRHAERTRETR